MNGERGSAEGNIITLIVSRYRFDISNRFRSDRREFASGCDTYATRYEIKKKRGRYASERRRRHQTSLTGSRVIQKTPVGLSLPADDAVVTRGATRFFHYSSGAKSRPSRRDWFLIDFLRLAIRDQSSLVTDLTRESSIKCPLTGTCRHNWERHNVPPKKGFPVPSINLINTHGHSSYPNLFNLEASSNQNGLYTNMYNK